MLPPSLSILLLCPFLVITLLQLHSSAAFLNATCSRTDTYASGSTFERNLMGLLDSLYTNATANGGFSALSFGSSPNEAYGLIMCYVDYSVDKCWSCLNDATSTARATCQGSATATIYYDECLLRYSSKDFRSQVADINDQWCIFNPNSLLDIPSKYLVSSLISNVSLETPENPQMTVNKEIKTNQRTISALMQCTRDLSQDGCKQCIQGAMGNITGFAACSCNLTCIGMRLMLGSCYIQYEIYHLNITTFPTAAGSVGSVVSSASGPAVSPSNDSAGGKSFGGAGSKSKSNVTIAVSTVVALVVAGLALFGFCLWRFRPANKLNNEDSLQENVDTVLKYILNPNAEYQVFSFIILQTATNNFSDNNLLGRGGFGPVYKGILPDRKVIAVKRLLGNQGITEFKNEVDSLSKLKHKNLVQFLGCCITNQEKLLCYEFLPNGSLDKILFARDISRRADLCWKLRYKIIKGISHGLHYLHEESPFKIIHRDLKVSNILLDNDMNPKISDFGLARFFEEEETHKATNHPAGTFGYMAPEYINCGNFSAKSDVYSFGILFLEILTGQTCRSFVRPGRISNFTYYAFQHWNNGTISQLKDTTLEEDCVEEIKRCVHIALLCVQDDPDDRPNMATIRTMLGSPSLTLPDLPSAWSPPERLHFQILDDTSTRFHSVQSQAEQSQGMTHS